MLKIGEFAKLCQANKRTLRYYDQIGVLCPDRVDNVTGYRYYSKDKIKTFQLIEQLKQLDFSLDEIKQFLACSPAQQCRIYAEKKLAITRSIRQKNVQVNQIDENCGNVQPDVIPLIKEILTMPFEDDPQVIGKWVYCGDSEKRESSYDEHNWIKKEVQHNELYFLPGGCQTWMCFWSKDYLYYILPAFNVVVPNPYRIFHIGQTTYMEIEWTVDMFINQSEQSSIRIYKQENTKRYSERETHAARDNVDVPFVADDRLIGKWETVDLVNHPCDFRVDQRHCQGGFWLVNMQFFNRGICFQTRHCGDVQIELKYSAGMIIDQIHERVHHYQILTEQGTDYLIMEHKYTDYDYLGKVPYYYVLKRKSP